MADFFNPRWVIPVFSILSVLRTQVLNFEEMLTYCSRLSSGRHALVRLTRTLRFRECLTSTSEEYGILGASSPAEFKLNCSMTLRVLVKNHDRYVVDKNRIQADSGTIRAIHGFPQTGTHKDTPASMTLLVLSLLPIGRLIMALSERKPQSFRVFLKGVLRSERFHS